MKNPNDLLWLCRVSRAMVLAWDLSRPHPAYLRDAYLAVRFRVGRVHNLAPDVVLPNGLGRDIVRTCYREHPEIPALDGPIRWIT